MLSHFLLPRLSPNLYKYIDTDVSASAVLPTPVVNESLAFYLHDIKQQIHMHETLWETYKKYTNTYEYIHSTIPNKKYCISRYRPLSRSFFKMIELIHFFELGTESHAPMKTFHLAEGPGGFIEAMVYYRSRPDDTYYGMTLLDKNNNDYNIPAWKKSQHFLQENKNVVIESGVDKTGNILSLDNFMYVNTLYGSSMDLITADGGFDFSSDFNNQEVNMTKLLYGQMSYALCMQKKGGCFVLKVFDVFMQYTIDIVALLSSMYERVYITKPNTSRTANSEKYVVCKGFLPASSYQYYPYLYKYFRKMLTIKDQGPEYISRIFHPQVPINHYFMNRIEECNIVMGQIQIENIYLTLSFIRPDGAWGGTKGEGDDPTYLQGRTEITVRFSGSGRNYVPCSSGGDGRKPEDRNKLQGLIKSNIQKCIQWCIQHNLVYNY
jgi:23S rRNA U2552 (ribose-2'-O)-methylase RlmE/FtsJ